MPTKMIRRISCVVAAALIGASCGNDQPLEPAQSRSVQPSLNTTEQDTTGKSGVGTLGSGNSSTQGGVGTIGSGN